MLGDALEALGEVDQFLFHVRVPGLPRQASERVRDFAVMLGSRLP